METTTRTRLIELENLNREMSRTEYEAICGHYGVAAMSDAECADYGVRYGEFTVEDNGLEMVTQYDLARRRMRAIDAEKTQTVVMPNSVGQRCRKCGRVEFDEAMFTTIADGDTCDDCM